MPVHGHSPLVFKWRRFKLRKRTNKLLVADILCLIGILIIIVPLAEIKARDVCLKEKPEDCYIWLQFSAEQLKKLKARKIQRKAKESNISKELEDSLLGTDSATSETSGLNIQSSTPSTSTSDPLQLILAKLESMQGRISSLERSATNVKSTTNSAVSSEIHTAEAVNVEDQDGVQDHFHGRHNRMEKEELESG